MVRLLLIITRLALTLGLASAGAAMAQDGYLLRPGEVIRVEVLEDASLNRSALVAPDGRISLPLAGNVQAGGRTIEQVQADIERRLADNFAAPPTVYVALERQREIVAGGAAAAPPTVTVYVVGEAAKPGKLELEPGTTVLQAFAQIGGFSKFAAIKRIQLRRGAQTWTLNYKAIEAGSSNAGATVLGDGDIIVVPQRKLFE